MVSVVIPVRNGGATIGSQLAALSIQGFDGDWEVVVLDNGSEDDTITVVERHRLAFPTLRVVSDNGGSGINYARNAGIRASSGDLILICDSDDVVQPGWIAAHVATLSEADISGGPLDEVLLNTPEVARFNSGVVQEGCPVSGGFLRYAYGGNIGFRRVVWESIGGFDDAWRRGATEIEFCWRAQLAGFRLMWSAGAIVAYRHDTSISSEVSRRFRSARSMPRLYRGFRAYGMMPTDPKTAIRGWLWLLIRVPWIIRGGAQRHKWLQVAAWRSGLVAGSLKYQVLYV